MARVYERYYQEQDAWDQGLQTVDRARLLAELAEELIDRSLVEGMVMAADEWQERAQLWAQQVRYAG